MFYRLVMGAVHRKFASAKHICQQASRFHPYPVPETLRSAMGSGRRMLGLNVLEKTPPHCHVHQLHTPANSQNRDRPTKGPTENEMFEFGPFLIYSSQLRVVTFPVEFGMNVKISTGEQHSPNPVKEKSGTPLPVGSHQRDASGFLDCFKIIP